MFVCVCVRARVCVCSSGNAAEVDAEYEGELMADPEMQFDRFTLRMLMKVGE